MKELLKKLLFWKKDSGKSSRKVMMLLNGKAIPMPITSMENIHLYEELFIADPSLEKKHFNLRTFHSGDRWIKHLVESGLVHRTKAAAIAHANAILLGNLEAMK